MFSIETLLVDNPQKTASKHQAANHCKKYISFFFFKFYFVAKTKKKEKRKMEREGGREGGAERY